MNCTIEPPPLLSHYNTRESWPPAKSPPPPLPHLSSSSPSLPLSLAFCYSLMPTLPPTLQVASSPEGILHSLCSLTPLHFCLACCCYAIALMTSYVNGLNQKRSSIILPYMHAYAWYECSVHALSEWTSLWKIKSVPPAGRHPHHCRPCAL